MKEIKLGIIGTNFVSDWLCEAVAVSDGIVNHAVYSRTAEKGGKFASKHGIDIVYTDMNEFLSSDIDAVYIASPNKLHFDYAKSAMEMGKHVLLEKPATLDVAEFDELCAVAEKNDVVLLEAMRPVHDPSIETVRENLGKIGKIRRATFEFCQYSSRYDKFKSGEIMNAFNPKLGNAAVMDIGVYAIETCVALFGRPSDIYARSVKLANGMEGMGTVFLNYGDFQAEVVYSKIADSVNPSVITGEDGSVVIGKLSTMENGKLVIRKGETTELFSGIIEKGETNMIYEVSDFVAAVNGSLDCGKYHEWTRMTLEVIDEIRKQNGIEFI